MRGEILVLFLIMVHLGDIHFFHDSPFLGEMGHLTILTWRSGWVPGLPISLTGATEHWIFRSQDLTPHLSSWQHCPNVLS